MLRQVDGYVGVEYDVSVRPLTEYPGLLAKYLFDRFEMEGKEIFLKLDAVGVKELLNLQS